MIGDNVEFEEKSVVLIFLIIDSNCKVIFCLLSLMSLYT